MKMSAQGSTRPRGLQAAQPTGYEVPMTTQCDLKQDLEMAKAQLFEAFVQLHDGITKAFAEEPGSPRSAANERDR